MKQSEFDSHEVNDLLYKTTIAFDELESDVYVKHPNVSDTRAKFAYFRWCINKSDIRLISLPELTQWRNQLSNIASYANSLKADPNGYSNNIETQLNALLKLLPSPRRISHIKTETQTLIDKIREIYESELSNHQKRQTEFEEDVQSKIQMLNKLKTEIETSEAQLQELQSTYNAQVEVWAEQIKATILEKDAEAQQKITDFVENQAEVQQNAVKELAGIIAQLKQNATDLNEEQKAKITQAETELNTWKSKTEEKGNKLLDGTRKIYEKTGSTALSMDFITSAIIEKEWYKLTVFAALLCFIAASIGLAYIITSSEIDFQNFENVLKRILLAAILFVPAWFLNGLAQKHRRAEISFRSLGLRVAAIEPYLSQFPAAEAIQVKTSLAEAFFTAPIGQDKASNKNEDSFERQMEKFIGPFEKISDVIKKKTTGN